MYVAYVLQDQNGKMYKGVTNNLSRRLQEHTSGQTRSTKKLLNPKVVYKEVYDNFVDACKREVYLKTAAGRRFLKKMLKRP